MIQNLEAENKYREAWLEYQKAPTQQLEEAMDLLQPQIANNPLDPRWIEFKKSLPGYQEFWDQIHNRALADLILRHPELVKK